MASKSKISKRYAAISLKFTIHQKRDGKQMKDKETQLEEIKKVIQAVGDYMTIGKTPENIDFPIAIHIKRDIAIDNTGNTVSKGIYFSNYDMELYKVQTTDGAGAANPVPLLYQGEQCKIDNLVWAVYAYMDASGHIQKAVTDYMDINRSNDSTSIAESLVTRPPLPVINTFGLMNDKVNTQLISSDAFAQDIDGQLRFVWGIDQSPGKKMPVTYIALSYEGTEAKISKQMTAFDNAVYNAVSTRFYYWKQEKGNTPLYITPQEIWRTMNGKGDEARPGNKQVERIKHSLDKMRVTLCYMDISEELDTNYITLEDERLVSGSIETYLLKADKVSFKTEKGRKVTGYRFTDEPILYTYNKAKNHILWFDYKLLDTSQNTSDSENVIEFRNYLLLQIQNMKCKKRDSSRVLYETLYRDTGIVPAEKRINRANYSTDNSYQTKVRQEFKKDREKVNGILKSWEEKGWIASHEDVKKGNAVIAVDIQYNPPNKNSTSRS